MSGAGGECERAVQSARFGAAAMFELARRRCGDGDGGLITVLGGIGAGPGGAIADLALYD